MKAYLVGYSTGCYDDWTVHNLFVTFDEEIALNYMDKFNRILEALKEHYSGENADRFFNKNTFRVLDTNPCFIDSIKVK